MPPAPIECFDLTHPAVPPALDGLTILQIADMHVHAPQEHRPKFQRLLRALRWARPDLIVLSGDYMTRPGQEDAAIDALKRVAGAWRTRHGAFGIFGNHDSKPLMDEARRLPGITWLENRVLDVPGEPLRLVGASYPEDLPGAMLGAPQAGDPPPFTIALVHYPTEIVTAADLGIPLVLAGHTHGGQVRPSRWCVPYSSSHLPWNISTGVLRLRGTVCAISRGVGEAFVRVRVNCPRQLPLYTLRRGPTMRPPHGDATEEPTHLRRMRAW